MFRFRDLIGIYIVAKFGTDWSIYADAGVLKSNMANFLIQGQITQTVHSSGLISSIIELIRNLMVIYIMTKFRADWLIFVDVSVNKKIVDG